MSEASKQEAVALKYGIDPAGDFANDYERATQIAKDAYACWRGAFRHPPIPPHWDELDELQQSSYRMVALMTLALA